MGFILEFIGKLNDNIVWVLPMVILMIGTTAVGGSFGATVMYACRVGMARSVFTHEAGMGSAPIAHASGARAIELGEYIVENGVTVRSVAKRFEISKSTVHTVATK